MRSLSQLAFCFLALAVVSCSDSTTPLNQPPEGKPVAKRKPAKVSLEEMGYSSRGMPGVKMEMHRLGAGAPDKSGWCHATSTGGGFSVSLPNLFNDFTMTMNAEDGVQITTCVVGTLDEKLVKFSATGMIRPDGKYKGDPIEDFAADMEKQGMLKGKRYISLGKLKGIEVRSVHHDSSAVCRLYKAPTTLYQLIVEAPNSIKLGDIEDDVKRFMDSFTVPEQAQE